LWLRPQTATIGPSRAPSPGGSALNAPAPIRSRLALALLAGLVAAALHPAAARAAGLQHVIEGGREAEVLQLVQPFAPEADVVPGAPLSSIRIERTSILYVVGAAGGPTAALELRHPDDAPADAETSASFALLRQLPSDAAPALADAIDRLAAAVVRNDAGGFWKAAGYTAPAGAELTLEDTGVFAGGVLDALWNVATDGVLLFLLGFALLLVETARALRPDPRWVRWALLGVFVVGLVVRLTLPIATTMTAHPFDRVVPLARRLFYGPTLGALASWSGAEVFLTDVIAWTNLVLSALTPLAVFAAARGLLRDPRAALAAAAVVAFLPLHVRFARSDVWFVQGVLLHALTLSTLFAALSESDRRLRWVATAALPLLAWAGYSSRPEAIAIAPLFVGAALFLDSRAPWSRRAVLAALLAAAAVPIVGALYAAQTRQVSEGLGAGTLANAWRVLTELRFAPLVHPWATPVGVTALALAGVFVLWLRRERLTALFLAAWYAVFLLVHAYIIPSQLAMQARYHLHLVLPYAFLAAATLAALWRWRRWTLVPLGLYVLSAPLVHAGFVRDVDFAALHEYALLGEARERIPDGCTVLEYTGFEGARRSTRVGRFALVAARGEPAVRWTVVETGAAPDAADPLAPAARAALAAPPECLMVWEGLTCYSDARVGEPFAPACEALHRELTLEPVLTRRLPNRPYDENEVLPARPPLESFEYTLYRARRP